MIKVNPQLSSYLSIPANLMMLVPCPNQVDVLFLVSPPSFWASRKWNRFHLGPLKPYCIVFHPPVASPGDIPESFGDRRESKLFIQPREVIHKKDARDPREAPFHLLVEIIHMNCEQDGPGRRSLRESSCYR
jgi:hypothetical protein